MSPLRFDRVFWIVLDGVGAGALPDAHLYGDEGSNSFANLARQRPMRLPTLEKLGLGGITAIPGVQSPQKIKTKGAYGKAKEKSQGKDTATGHWEMGGLILQKGFDTFPNGFPQNAIDKWCKENGLPGVLGNKAASGTEIIKELGEEHLATGKPILYTSADSVWQVAAHQEIFGLEKLYKICKSARKYCDELRIGRVIARPFIGNPKQNQPFQRTYKRKDYAQAPFQPTYLDRLVEAHIKTLGIGKIGNIFCNQGVQENIDTQGNLDGMNQLITLAQSEKEGLIFCNLIDTDMLYGHRRDVEGYANALEEFDTKLSELIAHLRETDLVLICSDHGNDPTFKGTDHTREYIPILAYADTLDEKQATSLGILDSMGDLGATVYEALTGKECEDTQLNGKSFLSKLRAA